MVDQFCQKLLKIDESDINCLIKRGLCQFILHSNSIKLKGDLNKAASLSKNEEQKRLIKSIINNTNYFCYEIV